MKGRGNPFKRRRLATQLFDGARGKNLPEWLESTKDVVGQAGILYLITNSSLHASKIGISSASSKVDRLQVHSDEGWTVHTVWNFESIDQAVTIERAVIAWWRNELKLPAACLPHQMPQGGYTETVDSRHVRLETIVLRVAEFIRNTSGRLVEGSSISKLIPGLLMRVEGSISISVDIGGSRREQSRQRWLLRDNSGELLVEVSEGFCVPTHLLDPGRFVQVVGRVREVGRSSSVGHRDIQFGMANPWYLISQSSHKKGPKRPKIERATFGSYPSEKELARHQAELRRKYIDWTNRKE